MNWKAFCDPNNRVVQLVFWFYSIEPAFYAELNRVCRDMDWQRDIYIFNSLGPFAWALVNSTIGAQTRRPKPAAINPCHGEHFARAFNVYRGAKMMQEWMKEWQQHAEKRAWYKIPGVTSTTLNPIIAVQKFAKLSPDDDPELLSVLFIFTIASES